MCALRICPPVTGNFSIGGGINGGGSSNQRCQVVREANTCCPKVQCLPATASAASDLSANGKCCEQNLVSYGSQHYIWN